MNAARHTTTAQRQYGQSATEFLIIFPVLIFLVFGVLQWALIYQARNTLNHAVFLAARAGALNNGSKRSMKQGLASGLTPLFAAKADPAGYSAALAKAQIDVNYVGGALSTTKLEVLNPTREAITDFGRNRLDNKVGKEIPNDTLMYRSPKPGKASKISVQDANILHLRVTYCYRLIVPVVGKMVHAMSDPSPFNRSHEASGMDQPFGELHGGFNACPSFDGPRIALRSEAIVRMQSPFFEENFK